MNDYVSMDERFSGSVSQSRCLQFAERLQQCGLMDLRAAGPRYTWYGQSDGMHCLRIRLDRVVANYTWRVRFEDAHVIVLPKTHGDHHPLMLRLGRHRDSQGSLRPFRFLVAWLQHGDFQRVFREAWLSHANSVVEATEHTREVL